MKKTFIKVLTLMLVAVLLVGSLASCGKRVPRGTYEAELEILGQSVKTSYTFKGGKVEVTTKTTFLGQVNSKTVEGKYEIAENDDGTMEITFEFETENDIAKNGTVTYKEGEDHIELGGIKYTKAD